MGQGIMALEVFDPYIHTPTPIPTTVGHEIFFTTSNDFSFIAINTQPRRTNTPPKEGDNAGSMSFSS